MDDRVDQLLAELYDQLLRQARHYAQRHGGSMQPSSVVNEVWIKLSRADPRFESREHFAAVAARAMRQVLSDRARRRMTAKRGGAREQVSLDNLTASEHIVSAVAIEQALQQLEQLRERAARVAELRLLGGLTVPEMARHLSVSEGTIKREWRVARAFLIERLG